MLEGKYQLLSLRELSGKNGTFKIAKLGDSASCTSFSLFVPRDLTFPEGLKDGVNVVVKLGLEEVGFKLRATLIGLKLA